MGYIGNEPTTGHFPVDNFTSSGGSTYTLAYAPASVGAIEVSVQGVIQSTTAYSISGTTLTIAGVTNGDNIFVRHLGETLILPTPADGSVTTAKLGTNSVDGTKIADGSVTTAKLGTNSVDGTKIAMGSDAAGDILYHGASDYARLSKGTAGQVLKMNSGATAPEWGSGLPTAGADGQVLTSDGNNWASEAAAAGGKVLQVVTNHVTTASSQGITINTVTNISNLSCPITPTSSSSKIMIQVIWSGEESANSQDSIFGLKRGSTQIGSAPIVGTRSYGMTMGSGGYADENGSSGAFSVLNFIDSPATTSATTYYVTFMDKYVGVTLYNNRTVADGDGTGYERMISSIILTELESATTLTNGS